jgi:hypothetical protein
VLDIVRGLPHLLVVELLLLGVPYWVLPHILKSQCPGIFTT